MSDPNSDEDDDVIIVDERDDLKFDKKNVMIVRSERDQNADSDWSDLESGTVTNMMEKEDDDDECTEVKVNDTNQTLIKTRDIKPIGKSIVHRICSGQVIVTLSTAVKEIVENSIDAGATSIEIRLVDHGSKLIEVVDNGIGITEPNFESFALKHHTSKLTYFEDLSSIATFGFRGEAISSLCALAKLTILTKSVDSKQAFRIDYDSRGKLTSKVACARQCGTTVLLQDLFSSLPVRHKEFLKNVKREFHKMVNVLYGYCLLHPSVRISCTNQIGQSLQSKVLSVPAHQNRRERIISLFGSKQLSSLMDIEQPENVEESILTEYGLNVNFCSSVNNILLEGLISRPHEGRSSSDRQFFFVNCRPCEPTKISRLVNEVYHVYGRRQYPFVCLYIKTKQENVDVNLTPDKRMVYLQNEKIVYATIKASLQSMFSAASSSFDRSMLSHSLLSSQSTTYEVDSSSTPSSSQENKSPNFRERNSYSSLTLKVSDADEFAPQYSGDKTLETKKQNIRSILQRFAPGRSNSEDLKANELSSKACSQAYKRPRQTSNNNSHLSKQLRLEDFMKLRGLKLSTSRPRVFTDQDFDEEDDDDVTIISENDDQTESSTNFLSESEVTEIVSLNIPDPKENDIETNEENSDSCFFSQNSNYTLINNSSQDSEISNAVIMYDDELEGIESLNVESSQYKSVNVHVNWEQIKERARQKGRDELQLINRTPFARKFRANISICDNSTAEEELRKELSKEMFSEMRVIGQFNLGFIIVKHDSDLFIIDQHASDEKYNFEMLQRTTVLQSQRLICPISLQLTSVSENILMENIEIFQKNGFEFEISNDADATFRVNLTKIPYSKNYQFGKEDVEELIFMLEDAPEKSFYRPSKVRLMFASRACRMSVMIGTSLSLREMTEILLHMGLIEQPWNCPHGRPTLRHLFNFNLSPDLDLQGFNH